MQRFSTRLSKTALILFVGMFAGKFSFGQDQSRLRENISKAASVESVIFQKDKPAAAILRFKPGTSVDQAKADLQTVLPGTGASYERLGLSSDKSGITTERIRMQYKGVPVLFSVFTIASRDGKALAMNGNFTLPASVNTLPSLTEASALAAAKQFVGAQIYAWEQAKEARDRETDPVKKALYNQQFIELYPNGELMIVNDLATKQPDLAWKFNIYAAAPMSRGYVYINAHTGKVMLYDKIIKHLSPDQHDTKTLSAVIPEVAAIAASSVIEQQLQVNAPESVNSVNAALPTRYAGVRNTGVKQVSGNDPSGNGLPLISSTNTPFIPGSAAYVLIDDFGHTQAEQTYDLNGAGGLPISVPVYGTAKSFTDVDNNWTLAEHKRGVLGTANNEADNDDFAFDAHWGATVVYQYWKNIHGRASFDANNTAIKSYVHYGPAYDNAFWNGSVMTYGDGSYQGGLQAGFAPLTSLDVCGHEIGHGVCSFTADLVYQGESGAMNEGFSDVWAACIENYAISNVDPTLIASATNTNGFKVWSIGEQIDARDMPGTTGANYDSNDPNSTALRYMDDPNKAGDPASYAEKPYSGTTRRWSNPNCTAPSLANDQCGVHTNSGVLNRLMYLLTVGGSGTVNTVNAENTSGAMDGTPYSVAGLGFAKAEKIMFLAERMLTPDATFLQARNAAVTAAEIIYGKCSFEWKQTIVAWNGVAVGASSDTSLCAVLPLFSAAMETNLTEASAKSSSNCTDAVITTELSFSVIAPGISNPVTVTVTPTGTATLGKDYTLSTNTTTYGANETGVKKLTLSVYNDGEIESTETIVLAIHAEDGVSFVKDTTITVNLRDDDFVPQIGNTRNTLLSENFTSVANGAFPFGWQVIDKLSGASPVSWRAAAFAGYTDQTMMVALKALPAVAVAPSYDQTVDADIILKTPLINGGGKNDMQLSFRYSAGGEPEPGPPPTALDYGRIVYSYDGINFQPLQAEPKLYAVTLTPTRDTVMLPDFLDNKQFYLGFEWVNDALVGTPLSFVIDEVRVTGGRQKIETTAGEGVAEMQYASTDIYYMSAQDREVIARVTANTADLGCVTATVSQSGNGANASPFSYGGFTYQRANKVFSLTPSPANSTASYSITVYMTTAELGSMDPAQIKLFKINDGVSLNGAISGTQGTFVTPTVGDFSSDGYYSFTGTFTGFSQFVLAINVGVVALPTTGPVRIPGRGSALNNGDVVVAPNPSDGMFSVYLRGVSGDAEWAVVNPQGATLQSGRQRVDAAAPVRINLTREPAGVYMLRIRTKDGVITEKLVVN